MIAALARLVTAVTLAASIACASEPPQGTVAPPESSGTQTEGTLPQPKAPPTEPLNEPPERKAILEALFANLSVQLSVHRSCSGVGTEATDRTIGDYLSGFLAEFTRDAARNWIETRTADAVSASGDPVWRSEVIARHSAGDDEWGWGVRFDIRKNDGRVVAESFECIGAG